MNSKTKLPTVGEILKDLSKYPPNFTVQAYEGEGGNGLIIRDPEDLIESGWIPTNEE